MRNNGKEVLNKISVATVTKVKDKDAHLFYIRRCYDGKFNVESLSKAMMRDDYHHQGRLPNNFLQTLPASVQAFRAISTFKDEYLLDDAFGEDQFIDILFINRALNCLMAVELKKGKFKTSYLGQLSGYLSILDEFEKKPHENPSIGIILCKDMNKAFVDFVIRDYSKPMGVATYKISADMSEELKKALPDIEKLKNVGK